MIPQPFGPHEHQAVRRRLGVPRVEDLLAQTAQSDPYYCGKPADWRDAEWFAELLEAIGLDGHKEIHLRRIHYRADALADACRIRLPHRSGRYRNDRDSWKRLVLASKHARRLGLVDPEVFVDRRNPDPTIHRWPHDGGSRSVELVDADGQPADTPLLLRRPIVRAALAAPVVLPDIEVAGYDYDADDQPVLVEVWCEKTTMSDVLAPAARQLAANYVPASGTQSITAAIALLRRAERHDRPAHVLYVSDHDDAGRHMPVSVARDVQFWRDHLRITQRVTVDNLVLTAAQVETYDLPRDPERGDATELDALEALRPGELARIITDASRALVDVDLRERVSAARRRAEAVASDAWSEATADLLAERDDLVDEINRVAAGYLQRADAIADEMAAELASYGDRLDALRDRAADLVGAFDPELPERPEPVMPEQSDGVLYDSARDWPSQLDAYRQARGKPPLGGGDR